MILKVKVTKEHLIQSMYCGKVDDGSLISENCAVAVAVRDVFPDAIIYLNKYFPFGIHRNMFVAAHNGGKFINEFDTLMYNPSRRLCLPETEIELEITDAIIMEATKHLDFEAIVNQTPHLQLIHTSIKLPGNNLTMHILK